MSTVQIAKWAQTEIEKAAWEADLDQGYSGAEIRTVYLGTVFGLDPCGRYHCMLSPNGYTTRCGKFWESLERQLEKRGLSLMAGEGDPCDQYAAQCRDISEEWA